ncbi:unnamed protein product [Pneumocystis jirovecii]|uniref:Protein SDA1 n=1 Tax=Pneumocystis jirovecii TaxID=42068 RepID=L0PCY9_PNEJI|nr:unnamed protein product [Pneumocystis jirovecii]
MAKKKNKAIFLPTNIPKLQNLIKRDPESYKEDFFIQWRHYEAMRDILTENVEQKNENFLNIIIFISQMCTYYPKETKNFPNDIATLLLNFQNNLNNETKEKIIQALILLKNKNVISSNYLLKVIFPILLSSNTKSLHMRIFKAILSEIKNANLKSYNNKINKMGKTILLEIIQKSKEEESSLGIWAVKLCQKLWKLKLWNDAFTVEIMKEAVLHSNIEVIIGGVHFFLNVDSFSFDNSDDDIEDSYQRDINALNHKLSVNKKSKKREREILKTINIKKKKNKKKEEKLHSFTAIQLLQDPQGFAEKLFSKYFSKKNINLILKHKLLLLQLLSKLIGIHKLNVLGIYTFLLKYLNPNQKDVTQFIDCAAHACHDLVPPDEIEPIIEKIANEFINDAVASEIVSVGLNGIRSICSKQPLAIKKELLQNLSEYKKSKHKSVMIAARSLIGLYREIAPEFLKKKDRRKFNTIFTSKKEPLRFGEELDVQKDIKGIEFLKECIKENESNIDNYNDKNDRKNNSKKQENKETIDTNSEKWIDFNNDTIINKTENNTYNSTKIELTEYINNDQEIPKNSSQKTVINEKTNNVFDLHTSTILTPLDFFKLNGFKTQQCILMKNDQNSLKRKFTKHTDNESKEKYCKKEDDKKKIARRMKRAKTNHSTTNEKKSRKKNFMMLIHKKSIQKKKKPKTNK